MLSALREAIRTLLGRLARARTSRDRADDDALQRRLDSIAPATEAASESAPTGADQPTARELPWWLGMGLRRPSAYGAAILAVAVAVLFVGALSYYGARKFTRDAADTRAAEEGQSIAAANAYTATGEAYNGYLQMLRYADDLVVASPASTLDQRLAALDYLVHLNTNKIASLAIVTREGAVLATSDPAIADLRDSEALNRTRASLAPTNSDIILPEGPVRPYVEFTAPLRDNGGLVWALLYGRADPEALWQMTLRSSVDGSRNVIINSEGRFAAGVPPELLREPWRGASLENGSVQADIVGVDSICGLGPIGRGSQIDHGWHVASCLPTSLVQTEADRAMGQQLLVTSAGAVLAVVLAAGALRFAMDGGPQTPWEQAPDVDAAGLADPPEAPPRDDAFIASTANPALDPVPAEPAPEPTAGELEPWPPPPPEPAIVVVADVNATKLIDAYEDRAARVSEQLRESVQARLMIASTLAAEAFRIASQDPARAAELHASAMSELDAVRDRELRSLAQQMHPGLVRLGLPAALRSLAKEFEGRLAIALDVDAATDAVRGAEGRAAVDSPRRLIVFRAVRSALDALIAAGAERCTLTLAREGDWLRLRMVTEGVRTFDEDVNAADAVAFEAYGGRLAWSFDEDGASLAGDLPAPATASPEDVDLDWDAAPDEVEHAPALPVHVFAVQLEAPVETLAASLRDLAHELAGEIAVTVTIDDADAAPGELPGAISGDLRMLAGIAARSFAAAGAATCELTLRLEADYAVLSMQAPTAVHDLPESNFDACRESIEAVGGTLTIGAEGGLATVVAAVPATAAEEAPPSVVQMPNTDRPEAA
jgi:hypothetical protein